MRLREMLRQTGDIDIVVGTSLESMVLMFNELAAQGEASNKGVGKAYVGKISINYLPEGHLKGFDHSFALQETRQVLVRGTPVTVQVPEVCIAAKLSGSFQLKDIHDIRMLHEALGKDIDEAKMRSALERIKQECKMDLYKRITS